MRLFPLALLIALTACQPHAPASDNGGAAGTEGEASPPDTPLRPATPKPEAATGEWSSDAGAILFTDATSGKPTMRIGCEHRALSVELPGVTPVGSEERLSFGGGGDVDALVVTTGTSGPVKAHGPAPEPARLAALLEAGPGASYGATAIGPLVPVPAELVKALVARCG